jgi:surface protein
MIKVDDILMVVIGLLILIIFYKIYKGSLIEGAEDGKPNDWDTGKKGCGSYDSENCAVSPNKYCIANTGDVCNAVPRRECKGTEGTWCKKPYCGGNEILKITDDNLYEMTANNRDLITCFDVSSVTTMAPPDIPFKPLFHKDFNEDISYWDVSSVTDMSFMFISCTSFDQDISYWDVSSVTNMTLMFQDCTSFNQNLSYWDVSSVTDMGSMFFGCKNTKKIKKSVKSWIKNKYINENNPISNMTEDTLIYEYLGIGKGKDVL